MSEMIERVASAMEQAMVNFNADKAQSSRDMTLVLARAAIEAMREPTEEMIDAACCCERGHTVGDALRDEYKTMIDAALSTPNTDKT